MKINKILAAAISTSVLMPVMPVTQAAAVSNKTNNSWQLFEAQKDRQDDIFQYHFAGGTDDYINGASTSGKNYDSYLWVPNNVAPGELKGLIAIKANLVEVPFAYSAKLKNALAEKGFGILFLVFQKDSYRYNNTFNSFNTRTDYKGTATGISADDMTTDGKDAADIMDDILTGIAASSGYSEIADTTPLITIGHSAASAFGYRSGNWNPDRIIAQVHMKDGMWGDVNDHHTVPGVPSLQYAAQYTEHDKNKGRDRSVCDARYHISHQRAKNTDMLVSHIIEWGSGHYDWSDNATDMMIKYIQKAIEYRLPDNYNETHKLNDLTSTGYLMKPFEKDGGNERAAGYYQSQGGWLSDGKANSGASEADKKASFWFFDEEFAKEVNSFTSYAIPPSPGSNDTKVEGATYSSIEPYMLMKNPSVSTYANTPASAINEIAPMTPFNADMSRYGNTRFVNYDKLANPNGDAANSANLQGYDTVTADTYYMKKIPSVTTNNGTTLAYDGAGEYAYVPIGTKAELVPLMAPYEIVKSEIVDMDGMIKADGNAEAEDVASVTRTTLRFHNNRIYYSAGCSAINEYNSQLDSFAMILSPEITENGTVTSAFKSTGVQMNVPYVNKGKKQTLTLNHIPNVNIKDDNAETAFDISYTSSDEDLQKYTDVFVEYGPAKAVRTAADDGSYKWRIEILSDEIPKNAAYPIEVNVVASNLGKWETTSGATASQKFYITDRDIKSGVELDGAAKDNYDSAVNLARSDDAEHVITIYSDSQTSQRSNMDSSENISFINGDFAAEVKQTSNNMMFLSTGNSTNPTLTFGKPELAATNKDTALTFNVNGKNRFAEINKGSVNLYNGAVITGGNAARGGGIDCKTGSVLNMYGGIISGNTATTAANSDLGGGGVSIVGSGVMNMTGGVITGNISTTAKGGGVSIMENGSTLNMSGGSIIGNSGYDVYMSGKNVTLNMSGSAKIGSLFFSEGKRVTVNGAFTSSGSHAEITPARYEEGTEVVSYADGISPSVSDFTVAADGETVWYTYADGQSLKLTTTAPFTITSSNVSVQNSASKGETVTVAVPDNYVENSLVVSGLNPDELKKVSDNCYSFTMPGKSVNVSCLVNDNPKKVIVVGTHDTYYVRNDNSMQVSFDVPDAGNAYVYSEAAVNIPVRAYYGGEVAAEMNGVSYAVNGGNISGSSIIAAGINIMRVTNSNENGTDYYSYVGGWNGSRYDYPVTAENLSTLTLTKSVSAKAKEFGEAEGAADADINSNAKGYFVDNLAIPSWNPTLHWQITLNSGAVAKKEINLPELSGKGSISIGIVVYGTNGNADTSDIKDIMIVE
ncbi:MAG: hypothetical protein Q4G33_00790 [bacterium]|nr:hypothetical protein [bacterium]